MQYKLIAFGSQLRFQFKISNGLELSKARAQKRNFRDLVSTQVQISLFFLFFFRLDNCQALVPSPVVLVLSQTSLKSKSNWDWGDTIILWATHPPPITFRGFEWE